MIQICVARRNRDAGPHIAARMLSRWPYSGPRGKQESEMNEEQIERFRQIVQEIATDESVTFGEAFSIASNYLASAETISASAILY